MKDVYGGTGPPPAACVRVTDPTLDIGFDAQYQWIADVHAITLKGAYIWENRKNTVELAYPGRLGR